jgi:hypothetical protein
MMRHQIFSAPLTLPEGKRRAALDLHVRKSFPFKDPEFAAFWNGAEATVYAWDRASIHAALEDAGVPRSTQVLPETFVRDRGNNGTRVVAMLEGFEGQVWKNGFLTASRWWPTPPGEDEWSMFLRSTGIAPSGVHTQRQPLALPVLERPWTEGTFSIDDLFQVLQTRRAAAIIVTAALCPFILVGTSIAVMSMAEANVRADIAALAEANKGIRADRAAAFKNLEAIEVFLALNTYPAHVSALNTALTLLGPSGVRIVSWSFDRGNLEIIVRGAQELDPTAYITMFERDETFEGVGGTLVGQDRDLQLRMSLTTHAKS